jgi:hypothetical protein
VSFALFTSLPPELRVFPNAHRLVGLPLAPTVRELSEDPQ